MEQAIIIHLQLSDKSFGSYKEREALFSLQNQMAKAIKDANAGELDGDEFGQGECVIYIYGTDADRLFAVVEPLLKSCPLTLGGYAIKRYGKASDPDVREVLVTW